MSGPAAEFTDSKTIPRTLVTARQFSELGSRSEWGSIRPALQVVGGVDVGTLFTFPDDATEIVIGRTGESAFRLNDPSVSRYHACLRVEYGGAIPTVTLEDLRSTNGTQIGTREVQGPVELNDGDKVWIGDVELRFRLMDRDDVAFQAGMRKEVEAAQKDPLTGLYTRRYADERLPGLIDSHRRNRVPLSVAMLDLDHFKTVNDTYGHVQGDRVLLAVADAVRSCIRGADVAVRFGGEEFAVILPGASLTVAARVGERIRRAVQELRFPDLTPPLQATVSLGVADIEEDEDIEAWVHRADAALYRAKRNGRNRVERSVSLTRVESRSSGTRRSRG